METTTYSATLIYSILNLANIAVFCVGLIVLIASLVNMTRAAAEGTKITFGSVLVAFLSGVLLMNSNASLSVIGNTYFNKISADEICFIVAKNGIDDSCFKEEMSGLTGQLENRIKNLSGDKTYKTVKEKINIVLGIVQLIGFIYFCVGAYGLKEVAYGSAQNGYGKPLTTMLASALIVDLPHTISMFVDTLNKIGIQF